VSQKRILLVDDEANIRVLLSSILEAAGYIVDLAEDGFVALHKLQHSHPDLLISDLRMPNMNGFELLSVVRTRFPQLPIIAISGEFLSAVHEGPLADAFFQKGSYTPPQLLEKVSDLLANPGTRKRVRTAASPVWAPTGDAPVMLTCGSCLRSFPIDPCSDLEQSKQTDCIFCGAQLEVQLVAVGVVQSSGD
jgi:CheY-like chemotaxis protein